MKKRVMVQMPIGKGMRDAFDGRPDIEAEPFLDDLSEDNIARHIADYDAAILALAPFTPRIVEHAKRLQVVSRVGVGYDTVDVPALTKAGIPLTVTGTANSVTVAEHALFLMLELAKRGALYDREARKGNWNVRFQVPAYDLAGRKALVLGFGRIGRRLVRRLVALEMDVLVYDPYVIQDAITCAGATAVPDWHAVLPEIDFLSVNCPKNEETNGMVGKAELAAMKGTAFVINTARGGIVDETALYHALKEESIAGAGIDAFVTEPAPADTPLFELENIIVSPHSAGVTEESLYRMSYWAAKNVVDCFDGKLDPDNVVNKEVLS
jgi:D-3-phosphoglycerate dehydrogenase